MARQVIERDKLGVLTKIAQGGQGVVYQAPNVKVKFAASMVYKEYKPHTRAEIDFTALAAMPALVEDSLTYAQAERLVSTAAWPCALVEQAGTPTGFVMPAIPQQFFIALTTVKGGSMAAAEFQHLLNHPSVLAARGISVDDAQRYSLLREVASGLAFLHKHGVCVGDISPKNLLCALTPHPAIYFIDCDAMRINGVSALRQVETPGWQVPAGEELATVYSDTYKLGLLALRLLVGDHDTTNPQHLPATTPDLLGQIITDTLTNPPQRRPLPEAWSYVLGNAIEAAQHQQKTATPPPVSTAPAPPPTPVVHSRPSTPPPPSAPPPPPQVRSRPSTSTPQSAPPTRPETAQVSKRASVNECLPNVSERLPESAPAQGRKRPTTVALLVGAIVILAVALALAVGIPALTKHQPTASPPTAAIAPTPAKRSYGPQVDLPFTGLKNPNGVAVDSAGNVYVADPASNRVLKLAAGSSTQTVLPFTGHSNRMGVCPLGVAVDAAGDLYVTDMAYSMSGESQLLELAAGSSTQTSLPFTGLNYDTTGVAVDTIGDLYVTDQSNNRVLKLAAGSSNQEVLPFAGLHDPDGVAVDAAGTLYVTDMRNNRVLKLPVGSSTPEVLPFTGLNLPSGVAVDSAGSVYITDSRNNRVLKLPAGSPTQEVLPFTGLQFALGVAVDSAGDLFVVDAGNNRVVKLPAG
jgi:sugar lactone lactonase YvrE